MALKLVCHVDRLVDHGGHVYTVQLRPERPAPRFRAGQFLQLALDPYDPTGFWPDSRPFSIASSPVDRTALRITYSVRGAFTSRMERELTEGYQVWIRMPYGDFVIDGSEVVLFAGGTGITPFTGFLESLVSAEPRSVVLAYGARTTALLVYRDVVEQCIRRTRTASVSYFVECGDMSERVTTSEGAEWLGGRVAVNPVWPKIRRPLDASYYIAGPPAMLRTISEELRTRGIAAERIHIDAWE